MYHQGLSTLSSHTSILRVVVTMLINMYAIRSSDIDDGPRSALRISRYMPKCASVNSSATIDRIGFFLT
jgi:hypothetical protein